MKKKITTLAVILSLGSCAQEHQVSDVRSVSAQKEPQRAAILDVMDIIRSGGPAWLSAFQQDLPPDVMDDPALTAVTDEYGQSVISMQNLPVRSTVAVGKPKPWSSWWYPKKEDDLFTDRNGYGSATFSKYDAIRAAISDAENKPRPPAAVDFERKQYNPRAALWEGLCDAWAIAAIVNPEPKKEATVTVGRFFVKFSIRDLKGLLLKTFEAVDDTAFKFYGQKFTGNYNGWILPDIFPDQFHRFIEVQLFERQQPFVMDHDPGVEVWNVPVYKANFLMEAIPDDPNAVFVRTWLYSAESSMVTEKDFVGTREAVREYDYILRGTRNALGYLVVESGYWVKGPDGVDSRKDHPDYLIQIPDPSQIRRKSWNPEIDVAVVDRILSGAYE